MPWTAIALVVAVFVLAGLLIVWLRQSDEPMEEGHGGNPGAGEDVARRRGSTAALGDDL